MRRVAVRLESGEVRVFRLTDGDSLTPEEVRSTVQEEVKNAKTILVEVK